MSRIPKNISESLREWYHQITMPVEEAGVILRNKLVKLDEETTTTNEKLLLEQEIRDLAPEVIVDWGEPNEDEIQKLRDIGVVVIPYLTDAMGWRSAVLITPRMHVIRVNCVI